MELFKNKLVQIGLILIVAIIIINSFSYNVENLEEEENDMEEQEEEIEVDGGDVVMTTESEPAMTYPMCNGDITASDLLPKHSDANEFENRHPEGVGPLADKNFISAGYHIGVNTIGSNLKNANVSLRSEPANPQTPVSPWNQSTINPDVYRRGFEIGCGE